MKGEMAANRGASPGGSQSSLAMASLSLATTTAASVSHGVRVSMQLSAIDEGECGRSAFPFRRFFLASPPLCVSDRDSAALSLRPTATLRTARSTSADRSTSAVTLAGSPSGAPSPHCTQECAPDSNGFSASDSWLACGVAVSDKKFAPVFF